MKYGIWFIIIIGIILIIIIKNNKIVDGRFGGILNGPSHKKGGIKAVIGSTGETVFLEGNENILTANVNKMQDIYECHGTPAGIASAINVRAGGVNFNNNGSCQIK